MQSVPASSVVLLHAAWHCSGGVVIGAFLGVNNMVCQRGIGDSGSMFKRCAVPLIAVVGIDADPC